MVSSNLSIEKSIRLFNEYQYDIKLATSKAKTYVDGLFIKERPLESYEILEGKTVITPVFSIVDLLNLIPKQLEINSKIYNLIFRAVGYSWQAYYKCGKSEILKSFSKPNLVDSLYELMIWCLNKNLIKL